MKRSALPTHREDFDFDTYYWTACGWCGADEVVQGSVCPLSLKCPTCLQKPGQKCKRPSEHDAPMHSSRYLKAEAIDVEHGIVYDDVVEQLSF